VGKKQAAGIGKAGHLQIPEELQDMVEDHLQAGGSLWKDDYEIKNKNIAILQYSIHYT